MQFDYKSSSSYTRDAVSTLHVFSDVFELFKALFDQAPNFDIGEIRARIGKSPEGGRTVNAQKHRILELARDKGVAILARAMLAASSKVRIKHNVPGRC